MNTYITICRECKYFVRDYFAKDMPIIIAHNICTKWIGKTDEKGWCYLAERRDFPATKKEEQDAQ